MTGFHLSDQSFVGDYEEPYIVAEINTSHFGKVDLAIRMVEEAKSVGVNCVKFQSWTEESLYSNTYYVLNPIAKRFLKRFSLSESELLVVAKHCSSIGIGFASTPYSQSEVDFLVDGCHVPFIKIASMDLNNLPFIRYIANKGVPIVLSTGMGSLIEIKKAVSVIADTGNKRIVILHCVSLYPTNQEDIHLKNILGLRDAFPAYAIGFSDHSVGIEMAIASAAFGAAIIEKHFTLDRTAIGMDNQMAIETSELKSLVQSCRNVNRALGSKDRVLSMAELDQRKVMRRSAVAARNLHQGQLLEVSDLNFKRPGTGVPPNASDTILGRRILRDIAFDEVIFMDDIS